MVTGALLCFFATNPSFSLQFIVGGGILLSAVFAFITSSKSRHLQTSLKYHRLHAAGLLLYALAVLFLATDTENFILITSFFLIYYGITEIIFSLQLLMIKEKLSLRRIVFRLVLGLLIAIGAVVIIVKSYVDQNQAILASGIVLLVCGANIVIFKTLLQSLDTHSNIVAKIEQAN